MAARGPIRSATAATALLLACAAGPLAEITELTLYQKTARAALVARVRALSDSTRRPVMEVLRVYKGSFDRPTLAIVPFRQEYATDRSWLRPEVFQTGREYILFMNSYDPDEEDDDFHDESPTGGGPMGEAGEDLFVVLNARKGVLEIPAEGAEAISSAIERFAGIIGMQDYDAQAARLRALLSESNPWLVEAGLEQVSDYALAREEDTGVLLGLLGSERSAFRARTLRILGQLSSEPASRERSPDDGERIRTRIIASATRDPAAEVRSEAVWALGRMGGAAAQDVLERISRDDPDQGVRYRAEVAIAEITGELGPPRRRKP